LIKELVKELKTHYEYVSVLGADIKARSIRVDRNTSNISSGRDTECGFVVKMSNGRVFFEYSLDDISGDIKALASDMITAFELNETLKTNTIDEVHLTDEPLVQSFSRPSDLAEYSDDQRLTFCKNLCNELLAKSEYILNGIVVLGSLDVSKLFISTNRELDQHYTWVNGTMLAVYKEN